MFSSPEKREEIKRIGKFRMQFKTRRDMFTALEQMIQMRDEGKLNKLIKIAEHELGFHFQIKPDMLMPRKNEFITDICNLIGLTHVDKLQIPKKHKRDEGLEFLAEAFEVSIEGRKKAVPYVFGDQSTYRDPAEPDTSFLIFKQNINRLESRVRYSKISIEKCYLYHEMGKHNLKQSKFDETRNFGRKIIDEAEANGNYLWKFLGQVLIVRADVKQQNLFKITASLTKAFEMSKILGTPNLEDLIQDCITISQNIQNRQ